MSENSQRFAEALQHHRAGELASASDLCRRVLEAEPGHADAWHLLGVIAHQVGRNDQAIELIYQALSLAPLQPIYHSSLGMALASVGKWSEAIAHYQRALRLQPELADVRDNLALALQERDRLKQADSQAELFAAASSLYGAGDLAAAGNRCRQIVEREPRHADAWHLLGLIDFQQGRYESAIAAIETALSHQPENALFLNNLGETCRQAGKLQAAVAHGREAVRLQPDHADMHHNLGLSLLADCLPAEAVLEFEEAIRLRPPHAEAHLHRSMAWQALGEYEKAWPEYEWRWQCAEFAPRAFAQPRWDGSSLAGRTILLHTEQGLGDMFHFIRYATLVKQRGATVIVECQPALAPLFVSCPGIDTVVCRGSALPAFDVHAPILSLPAVFGTTLSTVPNQVPYLFPDTMLAARWRHELSAVKEFKIGIVWRGNPAYRWDRFRSIALAEFAPLARLEGVRLFSLQKGPGTEELEAVAQHWPITDLGRRLDETTGAFMDTAAVMCNLDLVISPDTATAHLAGALGAPTWLALARTAEPRWLLQRVDSPWYPTMCLFRQKELGQWGEVFQRMQQELRRQLALRCRTRSVRVEIAAGELIDKITILEIKNQRITDAAKLQNVRRELEMLTAVRDRTVAHSEPLAQLTAQLHRVNETLWDLEDEIRWCERQQEFGPRFIELARAVYANNDRRAALKRQINELLGSSLLEEKAYTAHDT